MAQATTIITMPATYVRSNNTALDSTCVLPISIAGEIKWSTPQEYASDATSPAYPGQQIAVEENGEQAIYVIDDCVATGGTAKFHKLAAGSDAGVIWKEL